MEQSRLLVGSGQERWARFLVWDSEYLDPIAGDMRSMKEMCSECGDKGQCDCVEGHGVVGHGTGHIWLGSLAL
jgi:hypothetical protein